MTSQQGGRLSSMREQLSASMDSSRELGVSQSAWVRDAVARVERTGNRTRMTINVTLFACVAGCVFAAGALAFAVHARSAQRRMEEKLDALLLLLGAAGPRSARLQGATQTPRVVAGEGKAPSRDAIRAWDVEQVQRLVRVACKRLGMSGEETAYVVECFAKVDGAELLDMCESTAHSFTFADKAVWLGVPSAHCAPLQREVCALVSPARLDTM